MVTGLDWNMLRKYKCVSEMVVMVHVELYDDAADDSVNRNGEEEQPGYQQLKHLAFLTSWTNYFFGLTNTSHHVCMFLKGYNVAAVTLDVMLNCPFSFISKLLGNIHCTMSSSKFIRSLLECFSHAL